MGVHTAAVLVFAAVHAFGTAMASRRFLQRKDGVQYKLANESTAKFQSFKQTLHNFQNVQYFADFNIGGQTISGIFDTGSFELLVRSSRCDGCAHPTPPYDHLKSDSYLKNGTVTKHVFGSGPCISMQGYETVSVGHLDAPNQSFWEITSHRIGILDTAKFAAIVGIGPNFAYGNTEKTLLMSYGVDQFSICLQKPGGSPGYLTWGDKQGENLTENKDYVSVPVIGNHHWVASLTDVTFQQPAGGNVTAPVKVPCGGSSGGCAAIIDSGTSLIAAPGIALMQLSELIPQIKEDCSNLHELPTLQFNIDGKPFLLPPEAYVMRVTGANLEAEDIWDILFFKPKIRKIDTCMPAFMQMDMMSQFGPVWILGMPFFRYYHTTFDRTNKAMHFAEAGEECEPRPFRANKTEALVALDARVSRGPISIDVNSIVPPTLSEMMDYPYENKGELEL